MFMVTGRGMISMLRAEKRQSLNLERGDVLRIRAGTTFYLINRDNNEQLVIAKLLYPVNIPGDFEVHFAF